MPLSVLQALAVGVPCVVTDAVGNRDAVRQGLTGFVTNGLDEMLMAVRRVLHDDTAAPPVLGLAARQDAAERFSSASFRARLCRLYGLSHTAGRAAPTVPDNLLRFPRAAPGADADAVTAARQGAAD